MLPSRTADELFIEQDEERYGMGGSYNSFIEAAEQGLIAAVAHFRTTAQASDKSAARAALQHGKLGVVKWLREECSLEWSDEIFDAAVIFGDINNIKWLIDNGCRPTYHAVEEAAEAGHYEVVKWLEVNTDTDYFKDKCWRAALGGHYELTRRFHAEGSKLGDHVAIPFARDGNLQGLIWLKEQQCCFPPLVASEAAGNGHIEVLKWLQKNGSKFDLRELGRVARWHQQKLILEWLDTQYDSSPGW